MKVLVDLTTLPQTHYTTLYIKLKYGKSLVFPETILSQNLDLHQEPSSMKHIPHGVFPIGKDWESNKFSETSP